MAVASRTEEELRELVAPVVEAMGFRLVELGLHRSRSGSRVHVVVHREQGVGVDDCAALSRNLKPRLELAAGLGEVGLEVSSPGLERVLKDPVEYEIFRGRGMRLWLRDAADWLDGINQGIADGALDFQSAGRRLSIRLEEIVKAKLDAS
jgi:ribosome maturation factor RimP